MTRKMLLSLRIKSAALKVLKKELTVGCIIKILPEMTKMKKNGEPWATLSPAVDEKDIASRELIGEAILLYRVLVLKIGQPAAEKIIRQVIIESAINQLRTLIPKISNNKIKAMTYGERTGKFSAIVAQFPNADWEPFELNDNEFGISITRCRLVELIIAAGHPELCDAFCAGDAQYFETHQPGIIFSLKSKIAAGDKTCLFTFGIATD